VFYEVDYSLPLKRNHDIGGINEKERMRFLVFRTFRGREVYYFTGV
jgi:hypothetical protein